MRCPDITHVLTEAFLFHSGFLILNQMSLYSIRCSHIFLSGALIFSELALMFPKSGGDHTYLHETYGDVLAFLHGWGAVLVLRPMNLAIVSIVIGEYIFYPYFSDTLCYRDEIMVRLHAATFISKYPSFHFNLIYVSTLC